ncbi:MAG TPA: flagellar basal body-associated FliL family protein [Steroidobacteraceae bacterium]|nr:flagellar basal body-associated FliL family protein [Steroidobacteraceae bacterium]
MADIPTLTPAQDVALADDVAPAPRKRSRLPLIVVIVALVVGAAAAGLWFFSHAGKAKAAAAPAHPLGPPLYVALDPPFVSNFEAEQLVRFLQISVQVMSRDPATVEIIKANDPVIRNDLLLLFGNQKYQDISTRAGKERLRAQALDAVRRVIAASGGAAEKVEAVYFTSFVMQ